MNETNCPVCGERAEIKRIAKAFGRGNSLLVIEDIPMIVCRACHEQYITSETLHEIEKLRERQQHQSRMIDVERFAAGSPQ
jgi:YgiT-type zinc finger domain-containing protein